MTKKVERKRSRSSSEESTANEDLMNASMSTLKDMCKTAGLPETGTKKALQERLTEHISKERKAPSTNRVILQGRADIDEKALERWRVEIESRIGIMPTLDLD